MHWFYMKSNLSTARFLACKISNTKHFKSTYIYYEKLDFTITGCIGVIIKVFWFESLRRCQRTTNVTDIYGLSYCRCLNQCGYGFYPMGTLPAWCISFGMFWRFQKILFHLKVSLHGSYIWQRCVSIPKLSCSSLGKWICSVPTNGFH